jgi:peptidyl-prolyl cis-trans isomerase D
LKEQRCVCSENISTTKAPAIKDFSPYVGKIKGQSAGDVNRVLPALKDKLKLRQQKQFNY